MTLREIVPWRWGGLRHWEPDEGPFGGFRRQMESMHREMDKMFNHMMSEPLRHSFTPQAFGARTGHAEYR